jgi:hypothetical protein
LREYKWLQLTFLGELPTDKYPYLAEHVEYHLTESSDDDDDESEFEFGLDVILAGPERVRDATSGKPS